MAGILYRCIFCEVSHEVAKRADGPVYLRCPTTYQWAWYDARAFEAAGGAARGTARRATAGARGRARPASAGRRAGAASRTRSAGKRRAGRRAPSRPAARARSRKRGRR